MTKLEQKILKLDGQVPRYTSYPTAPHFNDKVNHLTFSNALANLDDSQPISLYLHIPYCREMCYYCGCNTKISKKYAPVEKYTQQLLHEISAIADIIGTKLSVSHIHFGGGTPNSLHPQDFSSIMELLQNSFNILPDAEIAIELDPRVLTYDKIENYAQHGINRGSLGVQDFNKKVQKAINRIQPYQQVKKAIDLLRQFKIKKINTDLIYGLPYQTVEGIIDNIDKILTLDPDRISLFGYAHVPWLKKHMRLIPEDTLPDSQLRLEMFTQATKKLLAENYVAIGLDHFVKKDDDMARALNDNELKRNFQGYTTDNANILIAMGCSAISCLPTGYYQNYPKVHQYEKSIMTYGMATHRGAEYQGDDLLRKEIIEDIMCNLECDIAAKLAKFNKPTDYFDTQIAALQNLVDDKIINSTANRLIVINPQAAAAVRVVASYFDEYFNPQTNTQHSKAI